MIQLIEAFITFKGKTFIPNFFFQKLLLTMYLFLFFNYYFVCIYEFLFCHSACCLPCLHWQKSIQNEFIFLTKLNDCGFSVLNKTYCLNNFLYILYIYTGFPIFALFWSMFPIRSFQTRTRITKLGDCGNN